MPSTVVFIHTVPLLLPVFDRLAAELLRGVWIFHLLDEPLLERVRQRGGLAAEDATRLGDHVTEAAGIGAAAVLVTCSTMSPCVDDVRPNAPIPVLKIDEAMIAAAVRGGRRIGVVATSPTTLGPTKASLEREGMRMERALDIELVLVQDALPALLRGDGETHDRLIGDAVSSLASRSDTVVLAQASMARVLDAIPQEDRRVPILSSPHLALFALRDLLADEEHTVAG